MKKLSLFFITCLSAFIFCSCDKDDENTTSENDNVIEETTESDDEKEEAE